MKPNLHLIEGVAGLSWDVFAAQGRLEHLKDQGAQLDRDEALNLAQRVKKATDALDDLLALLDELLDARDGEASGEEILFRGAMDGAL